MISEIEKMLNSYILWLKDKTVLRDLGEWSEITTPFLDRHNDQLQIYVKQENGYYVLSDDGYIINDLKVSGCDLDTSKRKQILRTTLGGFGIHQNSDGSLTTKANKDNFGLKKNNLLQAMLAVNDMFVLAAPVTQSIFLEDISSWMDLRDVSYVTNVKFAGHSGFDHMFDFVLPRTRNKPEQFVQAINNPKRDSAETVAFRWQDIKDTRPQHASAYAFLNDSDKKPSTDVVEAIRRYDITPILWSQREDFLPQFKYGSADSRL